MIVVRILYWSVGITTLVLLRVLGLIPDLVVSVGVLILAGLGLVFEALSGLSVSSTILHNEPADAIVEVVPIPGARLSPNTSDPRFGHLTGLESAPTIERKSGSGLRGRLQIFTLFLSRGSQPWSEAEIASALGAVLQVGVWVERQAQRYRAPVNVQVTSSYLSLLDTSSREPRPLSFAPEPGSGGLSPWEENEDIDLIASTGRAIRALNLGGIDNLPGLIQTLGNRLDADRLAWLLLPRSAGRSFASLERDLGLPGVNLAVIHAAETDLPGPLSGPPDVDPATIAHELLHLFGATDKYGLCVKAFAAGSVTSRDIMRLTESHLCRLQVDPLTASELLWLS